MPKQRKVQKAGLLLIIFLLLVGSFPLEPWTMGKAYAKYAGDLFISEYVEGSSSNKAIEIFNGTDHAVDLSEYSLELYPNGDTAPNTTVTLSGTLASGETYVIVNASAVQALKDKADLTHSITNFNGNDALVLKHNGTVIDSFGKVGEDPGTSWGSGNITTADHTLVRKSSITQGDTNLSDAFDPSLEWDAYPKDDASHLGSHTMDGFGGGGPNPEPGPVSTFPNAMNLLLDSGNPAEAKVMGDVNAVAPNAKVKLYLTNPKDGGTVTASVYAGGDGSFTLTFNNSGNMNGFVFLTATEEGKGESEPLELHEAVVSPAVDGAKVTFQVDGNGRGIVTGMAGAASAGTNTPFIYVYSGNPAEGGTRLTDVGTNKDFVLANTDGSFTFTFTNASDMGEIYLSQLTWSHYGRNFESSVEAVPKSDQPAEITLPINEVKGNDGNGKPLKLNETVTVEGIVTIANNI
ncbi:MAG: lamin tail domain-containing protein, partial [Thermicanus sp.]|nr:lamin tail domain-containing protein [Thermicanus sp.]